MRIQNYQDLKDQVQKWLNRSDPDVVNQIPWFIGLAEVDYQRAIKDTRAESLKTTTIDIQTTGDTIPYPADLLSLKHMLVNGIPYNITDVETFMRAKSTYNATTGTVITTGEDVIGLSNIKNIFCRITDAYNFFPELKQGDVVTYIYFPKLQEMVNPTDAPPSLALAGDLMLYLSLRHAAVYLRDNEQEQFWTAKAQELANSINSQLDEANWAGSSLIVPMFSQ